MGSGLDLAAPNVDDLAMGDDLAAPPDLATCPVGPEVCNNGCDDDRNGYIDDDDPACTSQMLVTFAMGTPALWRLILEPTPHVVVLDGNPVSVGGMASFDRSFSPAAYLAFDTSSQLRVLALDGGYADNLMSGITTRDVCAFNGELIVVSPNGKLHRFKPDGKTEIMPPVSVTGILGACTSDGNLLYVARHPAAMPSELVVFGKSAGGPVATGAVIAMPDQLLNDGYMRIVDFAYLKKSGLFIGLFAVGGVKPDSALQGEAMAPFGLDGGIGPYIDGGIWHGVGSFLP